MVLSPSMIVCNGGTLGYSYTAVHCHFGMASPATFCDLGRLTFGAQPLSDLCEVVAVVVQSAVTLTTVIDSDCSSCVLEHGGARAENVSDYVFRPFVTTKPGGMGIGLGISRSLVEPHGGQLSVGPRDGGVTVFQSTLPTVAAIME